MNISDSGVDWHLRLYVAGRTQQSRRALDNLRRLCEAHLAGKYRINVIDLLESPELAKDHEIVAVPMVVRESPVPIRKIIGDFSDTAKALIALQLRAY
jgi:circadian clock protein KaiB